MTLAEYAELGGFEGVTMVNILARQFDAPGSFTYQCQRVDGDPNFNPSYPFKMRGALEPDGTVTRGIHVSNLTYAIDVPVLTNAPFDILLRAGPHDLHCDVPVETRVVGAIHLAHSSFAEKGDDPIAAQHRPGREGGGVRRPRKSFE